MAYADRCEYERDCPRCGSDTRVRWSTTKGARFCKNDDCPWHVTKSMSKV